MNNQLITSNQHERFFWQVLDKFFNFFDFFYPPTCCCCGAIGTRICQKCLNNIKRVGENICYKCGEILPKKGTCSRCKESQPKYHALRSWAIFSGPLRTAIHSLKYQRNIPLGVELADQLHIAFSKEKWAVDLVVPVPLSEKRKKERGFNQAKIFAYPLAMKIGVPFNAECIRRIKETRSQVGLTIKERKFNVANAFSADQKIVKLKRILLVDDVATTGATLNECAISLLQAGAKEVYALTLARAVGQKDN